MQPAPGKFSFARTVVIIAILNGLYFLVEAFAALQTGSVALMADSIDFLEDFSVNLLIYLALHLTAAWRARIGSTLALSLLIPVGGAVYGVYEKIHSSVAPDALPMALAACGALIVNVFCAVLISRHRDPASGSLSKAAYLAARNDALANITIMAAGGVTYFYAGIWPDVAVGGLIILMNLSAAREVWDAARRERHRLLQ
ncbi:MAG: cation transporter [Bacteroidetes bacterium]|nr:cation transporter [Bacteroidota bacterium]